MPTAAAFKGYCAPCKGVFTPRYGRKSWGMDMKKILLGILVILAVLYGLALFVPIAPEEQRPGTRLSGAMVDDPQPDWSFLEQRQKIWVQTAPWYQVPHSVTTVSFVHNGNLYVPCGRCAGKRWPKIVAANDQVIVKIGGNLYRRTAVALADNQLLREVLNVGRHDDLPDVALYRMDPPAPDP